MDYDYVIDVAAGSHACIAGYSSVQAYITAVSEYYRRSGERGEMKMGGGKRGKKKV